MVQQVSLMATIVPAKYEITRLTLMSLTGMQPIDLSVHTVTLKPKFPFNPEVVAGRVNQIEQYRMRMNRVWESSQSGDEITGKTAFTTDASKLTDVWTLQVSEIPLAGKRNTSSQTIYEVTICNTDDITGYLDELGYMPETEFWTRGSRFFYNDIVIEVFKIYRAKQESASPTPVASNVADEFAMETDAEDKETVSLEELDTAKKYFIKASVNVAKITDVENLERASKQLEALKTELSGLFELEIPHRVAMDSRLNSRIVSAGQQPRRV